MYAKELLNREDGPKYVPYGHAHQSSVECVFSQLRSCKRNAAATVPKGLLAQTVKKGLDTMSMKKGKMYDEELLQAKDTRNEPANRFDRRDAHRETKLSEWMERRKVVEVGGDDERQLFEYPYGG
jgi:hypothetical protein